MVIMTNAAGNEIGPVDFVKADMDLGDTKDFEVTISSVKWDPRIKSKNRIFIPGTEFGGVIGGKKIDTSQDSIIIKGRTWRGILDKKVIKPPSGEAYKVVSGEVNTVIRGLISDAKLTGLFDVSDNNTGISVTAYQFDRYTTLLSGTEKMLKSVGCKLCIEYIMMERGRPGYVTLSAKQVKDYSDLVELSQDNKLNFILEETENGVNHLVCLGKGELTEREVLHLYIDKNGNVSTTQYYKGVDEVEEVYDFSSAESEELMEKGTEKLLELTNNKLLQMDVEKLGIEVDIGDIVGGRDYITGTSLSKPIVNKIYTEENGIRKLEYKLEGDEN